MKKLLVLFVALAVASTAFAADFSFSWDTDWGWSSNFDDDYNSAASELELAVAADIDEYNAFGIEIEPNATGELVYNYFKITTDLGAYLGLSGVGVSWVNGFTDPGDEEYADVLRVGLQNNGINAVDLAKDWTTDVNLDFGAFWASVAANWNLAAGDEAVEDYTKELQFLVGSVDAVPGLSIEAGYLMSEVGDFTTTTVTEKSVFQIDGAYVFPVDDALSLTVAGSFATDSEAEVAGTEQLFGAGLGVDFAVDDMTALNASFEFAGDDDESFRDIAGGVGLAYGDMGADVDFEYNMAGAGEEMTGVDMSGYVKVGLVQFRVGYAVTDYGWGNNNRADIPTEGGAYMRVTADF